MLARGADRRMRPDRRSGIDTRLDEERRLQGERRSGHDQRSGRDRRAPKPVPTAMRSRSLAILVVSLGAICALDVVALDGRYSKRVALEFGGLMDDGYQQGRRAFGSVGDSISGLFRY
jgi:hypothetical protein